jgi:hypothetical protein
MSMLNDLTERITADEAIAAMTAQAFHCEPSSDACARAVSLVRALCRSDDDGDRLIPSSEILAAIDSALGNQRVLVHCQMGFMGADWDLETAVAVVRQADEIGWCPPFMGGHNLVVIAGAKQYNFQVRKPGEDSR